MNRFYLERKNNNTTLKDLQTQTRQRARSLHTLTVLIHNFIACVNTQKLYVYVI